MITYEPKKIQYKEVDGITQVELNNIVIAVIYEYSEYYKINPARHILSNVILYNMSTEYKSLDEAIVALQTYVNDFWFSLSNPVIT